MTGERWRPVRYQSRRDSTSAYVTGGALTCRTCVKTDRRISPLPAAELIRDVPEPASGNCS
jgi:hypothetical protein